MLARWCSCATRHPPATNAVGSGMCACATGLWSACLALAPVQPAALDLACPGRLGFACAVAEGTWPAPGTPARWDDLTLVATDAPPVPAPFTRALDVARARFTMPAGLAALPAFENPHAPQQHASLSEDGVLELRLQVVSRATIGVLDSCAGDPVCAEGALSTLDRSRAHDAMIATLFKLGEGPTGKPSPFPPCGVRYEFLAMAGEATSFLARDPFSATRRQGHLVHVRRRMLADLWITIFWAPGEAVTDGTVDRNLWAALRALQSVDPIGVGDLPPGVEAPAPSDRAAPRE
ncbi:hypothetical protein L6R53_27805 [Myxococcota bacterium]|nr:hypothetical protein [Myxococcota bacterium]